MIIVPSAFYTHDATAGTITFSGIFASLELPQLVQIFDMDTNDVFYDKDLKDSTATLVDGVLTYTTTSQATISDDDQLRIMVFYFDNSRKSALTLTDVGGTELTKDTDSPSFYVQEASGAETLKFYINQNDIKELTITGANIVTDAEVAIQVELKWRVLGGDKTKYAYVMPLTGSQAYAGVNTAYPLIEDIPEDTPMWIEVTTAAAVTVGVNLMGRYKS